MRGKPKRASIEQNIDAIIKQWRQHTPLKQLVEKYQCARCTLIAAIQEHLGTRRYNSICRANHRAAHQRVLTTKEIGLAIGAFRTGTPFMTLCRRYRCAYETMRKAVACYLTDEEYRQICHAHLSRGGRKTRFLKGDAPWNKNVKGMHLSPATEFKKGQMPKTLKQVGQVAIRRNKKRGYVFRMIKVSGTVTGTHRWLPLATWIWQRHHGPVPKGFFVVHKDGDTLHDTIDNYELSTRAEHLRRNVKRDPEATKKRKSASMKKAWKRWRKRRQKLIREAHRAATKEAAKVKQVAAWERKLKKQAIHAAEKEQVQQTLSQASHPPLVIWMCSSCGHTYEGNTPPSRCTKCSRGGFERNVIPQRLVI